MKKMLIMAAACLMAVMTFAAQCAALSLNVFGYFGEIQQHFYDA